jgi:hypothetical protein
VNSALAAVLARPDVWRGDALAVASTPALPTGFAELDAQLPGGGWPRGQLTELLLAAEGIGELSLLMPVLAKLTQGDDRVVLVLPPGGGYLAHAPGWHANGARLSGLIVLRPANARDALWATIESLRCPAVAATLAWPDVAVRQMPANSLRRLQTAISEGGGCGFVLRPSACATQSSPAPLRLQLSPAQGQLDVQLLKRRGPPARHSLRLAIQRPLPLSRMRHALARPELANLARSSPARLPALA